jgi:hypothetical protein
MSAIEALRAARDLGVELTSREGVAIPQDSTGHHRQVRVLEVVRKVHRGAWDH